MFTKLKAVAVAAALVAMPVAMPVFAQSGSTGATVPAGTYDLFARADLMRAIVDGDHATLKADRLNNTLYVGKIVEAFDDPAAWYKIGQAAVLQLDPRLGRVLAGKMVTDEQLLNDTMSRGLDMFMGGLTPFVEKRKESVANGTFDPAGETAALMKGFLGSTGGMGAVLADAEYDANRLMLLAQTDPTTFAALYEALRSYVYSL